MSTCNKPKYHSGECIPKEFARNRLTKCGKEIDSNGDTLMKIDLDSLDSDECGLVFTEQEKQVIAELSKKQELRPAKVIKQALATYQLIVMGTHELHEVTPKLKLNAPRPRRPEDVMKEQHFTVQMLIDKLKAYPPNIFVHARDNEGPLGSYKVFEAELEESRSDLICLIG